MFAPFDMAAIQHTVWTFLINLGIGMGFGAVLEMAGFGDSRKLAAQFYLRDMTVLKVMFTGIITACVLIFFATGLGVLDFGKLWVNHTYLVPGILGGLIRGVGFIVGGFCPGTSVVAASTLTLDGVVFLLGVGAGILAFGETVQRFEGFWHSSYFGRLDIPTWLGLPYGVVVVVLVLLALALFAGAEISEQFFGEKKPWAEISVLPKQFTVRAAAVGLTLLALVVLVLGQPGPPERFALMASKEMPRLLAREIQVHPGEIAELQQNTAVRLEILDVRTEADHNLFHLEHARLVQDADLLDPWFINGLSRLPENTVLLLTSNDEGRATTAYQLLRAQGVINLYILEGGINRWLTVFPLPACVGARKSSGSDESDAGQGGDEPLAYALQLAVGDRVQSANPYALPSSRNFSCPEPGAALPVSEPGEPKKQLVFSHKVKLQQKKAGRGGCG